MRRTTKWITALVAAVLLGCTATVLLLRHEYREAKDRRDLLDLTAGWDRPLDELRVPDETPAGGVTGEISSYGMTLSLPAPGEVPPTMIGYAVLLVDEDGTPPWSVSCEATLIVVCTDLGAGYTLLEELDTDNSDPATTVRRQAVDLVFEARVPGRHPEMVTRLRRLVTETHVPGDAELLRYLRPDGYQTDWS